MLVEVLEVGEDTGVDGLLNRLDLELFGRPGTAVLFGVKVLEERAETIEVIPCGLGESEEAPRDVIFEEVDDGLVDPVEPQVHLQPSTVDDGLGLRIDHLPNVRSVHKLGFKWEVRKRY